MRDPEFDRVPFAKWFSEEGTKWKWSTHVLPVALSAHQRLMAQVQIEVPGSELNKRRGKGKLIFFFQFTDAQGRDYQDHATFDLTKVQDTFRSAAAVTTDSAFVTPGDYLVSFAVYCTETGEHTARKEKMHVPPITSDPFPGMWRDMPAVDFVDASDPPDAWFLPKALGHVDLPVDPSHPVRIEVVANLASTEFNPGLPSKDGDIRTILPYLKTLCQMKGPGVLLNVTLVDVERRRVVFQQQKVEELDWKRMRSALSATNNGLIDVRSLAGRQNNAAFLVEHIARRLAPDPSGATRLVIVLSGAMVFDTQDPPQLADRESAQGGRVFYIRIHGAPHFSAPQNTDSVVETNRRANTRNMPVQPVMQPQSSLDELAKILYLPGFRLFAVASAYDFRIALAMIVHEISGS
jgi:hypothetical protein